MMGMIIVIFITAIAKLIRLLLIYFVHFLSSWQSLKSLVLPEINKVSSELKNPALLALPPFSLMFLFEYLFPFATVGGKMCLMSNLYFCITTYTVNLRIY